MQEKLKDRIAGAVVGYAIGDALGLGTEFMTADEAKSIYPDSLSDYSQIELDAHRSLWGRGNWTNDTRFIIMLLENILRDGELRPLDFARSMIDWYDEGAHYDIPQQLRSVLREPTYREDPLGTARKVWCRHGRWMESVTAIGVAPFAGMVCDDPDNEPVELCRTLQCGPMSLGATNVIARTARALLFEGRIPDADELVEIATQYSPDIEKFIRNAAAPDTIHNLKIDDYDTVWMIRKCMAVALWALWNFDNFDDGMTGAVMLGGDADTNAALAGALMGLRFGLSGIPERLRTGLVQQQKIEDLATRFADFLAPKITRCVRQ